MPAILIGSEGNRIEDRLRGLVTDTIEYRSERTRSTHSGSNSWYPVLALMSRTQVAKESGLDRRTIQRHLCGQIHPHEVNEQVVEHGCFHGI